MNIVIDSNILFSALIKDSLTRKMVLDYDGMFLFPEFIFEEMEEHKSELLSKSKLAEVDFEQLLLLILRKVKIISKIELYPFKNEAWELVKNIDPDDVLFVACALAYSNSIIWSDDKGLKQQNRIKVLNTSEMVEIL